MIVVLGVATGPGRATVLEQLAVVVDHPPPARRLDGRDQALAHLLLEDDSHVPHDVPRPWLSSVRSSSVRPP
jgi:hypothetical protein